MLKHSKRTLPLLAVAVAVGVVFAGLAVAEKGGKKPPPEPPAPADPAIAYTQFRSGKRGQVFQDLMVINADGSNRTMLLEGTASERYYSPSWSPDLDPDTPGYQGTLAVVLVPWPSSIILVDVAVIDGVPTAGPRRELVRPGFVYWWLGPDWSPDGKWIAFGSHAGKPRGTIRIIATDGTDTTGGEGIIIFDCATPAEPVILNYGPCWSPDGTEVAFVLADQGLVADDVDPSTDENPRIITGFPDIFDSPEWSNTADVDQIAFGTPKTLSETDSLYVVDAEGGIPVQLTDDTVPSPSWSPFDSFLVLRGRAEGKNGIVKLDLLTGEKTLLAPAGGKTQSLRSPHWRPDARPMLP